MQKKIIIGGLIIGILNLIFYLVVSPKIFGKSTGLAIGGPLATTFAWTENTVFGRNRIFAGIPPIFWTLVPGIIVGAFISALLTKRHDWASFWKTRLKSAQLIRISIGGILVGFGVLLANGCLVKHALSGLPGLSLESMFVVVGIVTGIWLAMKIEEKWLPHF